MSGHSLTHIRYEGKNDHSDVHVAIIVSKWNAEVTEALYQGAVQTLISAGVDVDNISRYNVPGSFELPQAAEWALNWRIDFDGAICLGCVIQGETRHFEFISQAVASSIMQVGLTTQKPVIFGVLTPDNMEQALARAGGKLGNKGEEAAVAFLEMLDLAQILHEEAEE